MSTGVGVPVSIAAIDVQRPSPESDTRPANPSSAGDSWSAAAVRSSSHEDDDAAAPPELGDRGDVEVVAVELGLVERRGLGVLVARDGAGVRVVEEVEALGVGGHQPVLDPVVHHLHEVAGPGRAAVQPALLLGRREPVATRRARRRGDARRERREERGETADGLASPPSIRQ